MTRVSTAVLLFLALGACQSVPTKIEARTRFGIVRSADSQVAIQLAMAAQDLAEKVCAELQVQAVPPFVIDHVPEQPQGGVLVTRNVWGTIVERRIVLGDFVIQAAPRFAVAHELVHWYAHGPWDLVPHAVEEGLADFVALRLVPQEYPLRQAILFDTIDALTPERRLRALELGDRGWKDAEESLRADSYAVGFEILLRLGIDGVLELCERAEEQHLDHVPWSWMEPPGALPEQLPARGS